MKVTILGCGPAGLLAAQAAGQAGASVQIYSRKVKSRISGAQFIHREIPGVNVVGSEVEFVKVGDKEGYATKVYGDPDYPCSWDTYREGFVPAWPMKKVYDELWERWQYNIFDCKLDEAVIDTIPVIDDSDLYVSSIPAPTLCRHDGHSFQSVPMYVRDMPGVTWGRNNLIIYNGMMEDDWYRVSCLWGDSSLEYGMNESPPGTRTGYKPTNTNCDCRSQWMRVGRYGRWERGILSHTAFEAVESALLALR